MHSVGVTYMRAPHLERMILHPIPGGDLAVS